MRCDRGVAGTPRRYLTNITIPAAFVTRTVGDNLKKLIKPTRDQPHPKVLVSLDWTDLLPHQEVVRPQTSPEADADSTLVAERTACQNGRHLHIRECSKCLHYPCIFLDSVTYNSRLLT